MTGDLNRPLAGKKIGIFGKGGSGKSTLTVLLAKALRGMGYKVVVLGADSTNVGLTATFGLDWPPQPLIDFFGGLVFSGGSVTCPVDDPSLLTGAEVTLSELPGKYLAYTREGIWFLVIDKFGKRGPGAGCDGPIAKIARDLIVHAEREDPVVLIDFKAGIEDSARGVITGLHWALVTVNPTLAGLQVAVDMRELVEKIKAGVPPATRHLDGSTLVDLARSLYRNALIRGALPVLTNIPDSKTERFLRDRLTNSNMDPIGVIHTDPSISTAWLHGSPLDSRKARMEARRIVESLNVAESNWSAGKLDAA